MKILVDTQALIWFAEDNRRLSEAARAVIEDGNNEVYYSAASIWEMAIKISIGKLRFKSALDDSFKRLLQKNWFEFLAIDFSHAARVATLPVHHSDPFDRLLIAQAMIEGMRPVSNDSTWDAYGVQRIWGD